MQPTLPPAPCSNVRLPAELAESEYRLVTLDSVGSTNDEAMAAARRGDPGRLWIVAREQRAGRGRHGRQWSSPRGNLYASLLLVDPCEPARAPQLGFVAGIALHEAVAHATGLGSPRLGLKWPNDLLLDGAKVAGLLVEGSRSADGAFAVVIGFGVNVAAAPDNAAYPTKALRDVDGTVTPETLLAYLAEAFSRHLEEWRGAASDGGGDPFATVRAEWLSRAAGLGDQVTIRLATGERSGSFAGLDQTGRLQLRTAHGTELIDAGDLYFPASRADDARAAQPAIR